MIIQSSKVYTVEKRHAWKLFSSNREQTKLFQVFNKDLSQQCLKVSLFNQSGATNVRYTHHSYNQVRILDVIESETRHAAP